MKWFFVFLLVANYVLVTCTSEAADRDRPIRIGALTSSWGPSPPIVGLRDGLRELGYRENEQFIIGVRFTQGDLTGLPDAARDLIQNGSDLIFATEEAPAKAAQMATKRLPIVFAGAGDPLGLGLVESFARPGGNITGVTDLNLELLPKRLELFREIIAGLKRVLFPYDPTVASAVAQAKTYRRASRLLGIELVERPVRAVEEARATLAQVRKDKLDGILSPRCCSFNIPGFVLKATSQQKIPSMFSIPFFVERGGLVSYGSDLYELGRQAARLVDKILKGTAPSEIPVEVNSKIEFVINLKVAKALGLTIPPEVLYRADQLVR
jgi:putative ABC transport system substrate-binding protein